MDRQQSTLAEPAPAAQEESAEEAVHQLKAGWVNEAMAVKGLLALAVVAAGLALLAEDGDDGPLSTVWPPLNDFFASVALIPSALALALVVTVFITRMPRTPGSPPASTSEETIELPRVQEPAEVPDPVEPQEPATDYDSQVRAMSESVAAWSPPEGIDPASEFAEILTRQPPRSPWRSKGPSQ